MVKIFVCQATARNVEEIYILKMKFIISIRYTINPLEISLMRIIYLKC